ncbi:MAG TPA: MlaD family protein [Solirubrobacteraceae bacterium]
MAVIAAIAAVAFVLLSRSAPYTVTARFENASQIVKGNLVQVAGSPIGTVESIKLSEDGQAILKLKITEDKYTPLRQGTRAIVRQASLSGIANRYIDLQLGDAKGEDIGSGGRIDAESTVSQVDLDQVFNTFDPVARTAVQRDFAGFAEMYAGRSKEANEAFKYLNPALASSSQLFQEINRDSADFERFIVQTAGLVNTLASRDDDLAGLIDNLATTASALAAQRGGLSESIQRLPGFMRKTNTTFVNLRAALDDLDPLVRESRPAVRRLRPFLAELRPFARDAVPTLRDLSKAIRTPGADNDLIEVLQAQPAVDRAANRPVQANGEQREATFKAMARSLKDASPQIGFFRPYTPDLMGWFDDFSTSGAYDAIGAFSRAGLELNAFTFTPVTDPVTSQLNGLLGNALPIPEPLRQTILTNQGALSAGRNNRCPGSAERSIDGSNPYKPSPDFNCDEKQVPIGP